MSVRVSSLISIPSCVILSQWVRKLAVHFWIHASVLAMWDIYGERWNLSEDHGREKFFWAIVKFHKMSTNVQEMSKLGRFQWGKWIMDYGIFRLGPTLSSASERAFLGFFGDFFVAELPQKKRCLNIQEFTRSGFLSTGVVTAVSRALWRVFSNKVIRVLGHFWVQWHPINTHLWVRLFVSSKLFALHRHGHAESLGLSQ